MQARVWRVAMLSTLIFALGCVGCATRSTSTSPASPAPSRLADASVFTPASDSGTQPGSPARRPSPREFMNVAALEQIRFEFDKVDIGPEAARTLDANAEWLRAHPSQLVLVAGHADERGTSEYNLVLGERRARATVTYLVAHGVAARRFTMISYGEERGVCREHQESCWSRNRRATFAVKVE